MVKLLAIAAVVILVLGGVWFAFEDSGSVPATAQEQPTAAPATAPARGEVVAEAKVVPVQSVVLRFPGAGTVAEVLVAEGDTVKKGASLVQLETRALELAVQEAQARLSRADADYQGLVEGATPEDIAAAQAAIDQAAADLQRVRGGVTAPDLRAARADVEQARARLQQLQSGAKSTDREAAQASVRQSEANLQSQRDALSAAKTDARLRMDRAVNELTEAQAAYATAKQNRDHVEAHGADPVSGGGLNEAEKRAFYDAHIGAEARLRSAEQAVTQAQLAYDAARQAEATGVAAAEAQLTSARTELRAVEAGSDADVLAAARAELARAEAELARLSGPGRAGEVGAAEANVDSAQAALARLQADPKASALARGKAEVDAAAVALEQAQYTLTQATLKAPIDGTVARVTFKVGEQATAQDTLVVLADLSQWQIETDDLTELDVVRVRNGSPATLRFDALPGVELAGTVTLIKPIGENKQGDITYTVVVTPDRHDERLRWNMTAEVTFAVEGQ